MHFLVEELPRSMSSHTTGSWKALAKLWKCINTHQILLPVHIPGDVSGVSSVYRRGLRRWADISLSHGAYRSMVGDLLYRILANVLKLWVGMLHIAKLVWFQALGQEQIGSA